MRDIGYGFPVIPLGIKRLYPNRPIVGVGILIKQGEKYLLIKRAADPDKGMWSIPGGLVKVGETTIYAAWREALEETGLTVRILENISVIDNIDFDADGHTKYHFIIIDYLAEPISGVMHHHDDALDAYWARPVEFHNYQLTPTVIQLFRKIGLFQAA